MRVCTIAMLHYIKSGMYAYIACVMRIERKRRERSGRTFRRHVSVCSYLRGVGVMCILYMICNKLCELRFFVERMDLEWAVCNDAQDAKFYVRKHMFYNSDPDFAFLTFATFYLQHI